MRAPLVPVSLEERCLTESTCIRIALRGDPKDEAHLVTRDATFLLKSVQTSNTMILLAPQDTSSVGFQLFSTADEGNADGYGTLVMTGSYIEVLPTAPKIARARAMLDQVLFRGFENEDREVIQKELKAKESCLRELIGCASIDRAALDSPLRT